MNQFHRSWNRLLTCLVYIRHVNIKLPWCYLDPMCTGKKYKIFFFFSVTDASRCCTCACTSSTRRSSLSAKRSWATTWWRPQRGQNTTALTANSRQFLLPRPPRAQKAACVARAAATRLPVNSWGLAFQPRPPLPCRRAWCRSSINIATFSVNVTSCGKWRISVLIEDIVKVTLNNITQS